MKTIETNQLSNQLQSANKKLLAAIGVLKTHSNHSGENCWCVNRKIYSWKGPMLGGHTKHCLIVQEAVQFAEKCNE